MDNETPEQRAAREQHEQEQAQAEYRHLAAEQEALNQQQQGEAPLFNLRGNDPHQLYMQFQAQMAAAGIEFNPPPQQNYQAPQGIPGANVFNPFALPQVQRPQAAGPPAGGAGGA